MTTPLHEQARRFAEAGIKIFPCVPDGKAPATTNGFKDASDDPQQIEAWWTENPNYNIALCPEDAGWCVIDIDPGGEASWIEATTKEGGHEPTYEVGTPRGGRHLYFKGSIPSSASKLGAHVDTRGVGGYVLVPPSMVGGKSYGVTNDRDIAICPGWIATRLAQGNRKFEGDDGPVDTASSVARANDYLGGLVRRGDVAISGHGGNSRTYKVFAFLRSLGVSGATALGLVLEHWNPACQPPWPVEEILPIRDHAYQYGQNAAGADDVTASAADAFGKTDAFKQAMAANKLQQSRYRLMSAKDFDEEPDPKWIVEGLIPDDSIVLWMGPSQTYKSFMLLDLMLGVATGKETFGCTPEPGPVLYGALEDLRNIGKVRRRAWQMARGLEGDALDNFRGSDVPYLGMTQDEEATWHEEIRTWLNGRKLKLCAIDTASKVLAGLNENDGTSVRAFYAFCSRLRDAFGCTVIAVHHSGKDVERGARGSGAWTADFDSVIETIRPDKKLMNVEVTVRKHKNTEDGKRWTFKGSKLAGSLVFNPSTPAEHREAEEAADPFAPTKIGRALSDAKAHSRNAALTSAMLWQKLGGIVGDEAGVRKLDKLSKTTLKAYVEHDGSTCWWWYDSSPGGSA
jgi:hypothetical protein